jgi:hypothetical protein
MTRGKLDDEKIGRQVSKFISAVFLTTGSKPTMLVARNKSGLDAVCHSLVSQIANIPQTVLTDPCTEICFRHCLYSSALIQSIRQVLRTTSLDFQCPVRNDLIKLQCIRPIIIFRQLVRYPRCLRVRRNVGGTSLQTRKTVIPVGFLNSFFLEVELIDQ